MYNLPILSQLILLLHWVLVTLSDFLAPLGYRWQWGLAIIGLTYADHPVMAKVGFDDAIKAAIEAIKILDRAGRAGGG